MSPRRFNLILFVIVAAYAATGWALAGHLGAMERFSLLIYSRAVITTTVLIAALFFSAVIARIMIVDRPRQLTRTIAAEMSAQWFTKQRLSQGLPIVIAFLFFMAAFTSLKTMIPLVQPYAWDQWAAGVDRMLHFGRDPWALLQPLFGYPVVTFSINVLYNLWFPVMFGVLYWQAFSLKNEPLRQRYFSSFFLCWIINGTILAMVLSSVGPCFYGELNPAVDDPYQGLMAYLRQANEIYPIWSLATQDMLWQFYSKDELGFGSGISAMPSLHVSIAFLQALLGYQVNRKLGHALAAFCAVIVIGSIHLGWHYAADGYLAIIVTVIIWWGMGRIVRV